MTSSLPDGSRGENPARRLAGDTARFFAATLASRLLQFAYFLVVMRTLAADDRGRYSLTLALASIASMLMALGYEAAVAREIGRAPADRWRILRAALVSKGFLGGGILVALTVAGFFAWHPDRKAVLLALFGVSVFLESQLACYLALFQATGELSRNGLLTAAGSLLTLAGGGAVVLAGGGVLHFALVVVVVQGVRLLAAARMARRHQDVSAGIDRALMKRLWDASATIGLMNLMGLLFVWADTLFLGFAAGDAVLGEYAPVRTLTGHAGLIPMTLRTAVFPVFVALAARGVGELGPLYGRCCQVLLALALPIALLGSCLADPIAGVLFGAAPGSPITWYMKLLPWVVPFSFLQSLCALALIAMGRERSLILPQTLVMLLYGGFLAFGTFRGGGQGTAWAALAGTALNFLLFLPLLRGMRIPWLRAVGGPAAAALLAGSALLLPVPWWGRGGAFLAAYATLLVAFRVFRRDHLDLVWGRRP